MVQRVRNIRLRHQRGSAALIMTIAISSILVVLFVGITTIATREIRQSINADNANRALYAAEAGVEDAVRRLAEDPSVRESTCNALNSGAEVPVTQSATNNPDVAWTCRTITTTNAELTGRLNVDESLHLNLARARASTAEDAAYVQPASMTIEWNDPRNSADAANPLVQRVSSWLPAYNPPSDDPWPGAAALEITSTWLQTGALSTSGDVTIQPGSMNNGGLNSLMPVRTVIASPACTGSNCTYSDFSPWNNSAYPGGNIAAANVNAGDLMSGISTRCESGNSVDYSCRMPASDRYDIANLAKSEINNGSANIVYDGSTNSVNTRMVLRIRPRYNAASYRIRFYDSSGNEVFMPDGSATIDVTARSGNYLRRVIAKKQLVPKVYDGVFDNALFSGGDICKNMRIYRDYRGAPDLEWNGTAKVENPNAGRNHCGNNSDN